ncbi:MAG: TMEM175 family protein [Acidimicrobiales bacterium]
MDRGRLEAFSDGVFAIAITLLALDLAVPRVDTGGLPAALGHQWPQYAAFVVSFAVIGIIWINHHGLLALAGRVDRTVLALNLVVLLAVVSIPFSTRLLATYLTKGGTNAHVAAAVYSGVFLVMAIAMSMLFLAITGDRRRLHESLEPSALRAGYWRFGIGQLVYLGTVGLSFVSAPLTLAVHLVVAVYYLVDQLRAPTAA